MSSEKILLDQIISWYFLTKYTHKYFQTTVNRKWKVELKVYEYFLFLLLIVRLFASQQVQMIFVVK